MPELCVVIGILALLIAMTVPPLLGARRQAIQTQCAAQLQALGKSLEHARTDFKFYPYWDDGGAPIRYTWIDLLVQRRYLDTAGNPSGDKDQRRAMQDGVRVGYCPADLLPDPLNEVRHPILNYPLDRNRRGVDYSYGIGAPLSAGGWAWAPSPGNSARSRRFRNYDRNTSGRLLAGDAYAAAIFNMSGDSLVRGIWNDPTQFDNTIAWGRHGEVGNAHLANLLFQDGHVQPVGYRAATPTPVNTMQQFVWYPGEPLTVDPEDQHDGQFYPSVPPPSLVSNPAGDTFPAELMPAWYTRNREWTRITHK